MTWQNPNDESIQNILSHAKTVAVVGCSPNAQRTSHQIAAFLLKQGYQVIPVHPKAESILGQKVYPSLNDIPSDIHIDIVDVFRKAEFTPDIAKQTIAIGAGTLWLQQGIINEQSYQITQQAGVNCVMDLCIAVMHRLLMH